jgi:hypothetical protein
MEPPRVEVNIAILTAPRILQDTQVVLHPMSRPISRVVVAVTATAFALAAGLAWWTSISGARPSGRNAYLAQARAICREYSADLNRIPPIQDPTMLGDVIESTNAALPLLHEQAYRIQELTPPPVLKARVDRFFVLTNRSIHTLESVRNAALKMNSGEVGMRLIRFGRQTDAAKRVGRRIGYGC